MISYARNFAEVVVHRVFLTVTRAGVPRAAPATMTAGFAIAPGHFLRPATRAA